MIPPVLLFVQVSDIHVSIFSDASRLTEFSDWLRHTVSHIDPAVVIASGDLTDARDSGLGSIQHVEEWQMYYDVLKKSGVLDRTTWLDIRGNHDTFNVDTLHGDTDYFKNYSVQGAANPRSYAHHFEMNGDRYTFIGVDASLHPGPKRPFNFIGQIAQDEINHIRQLLAHSKSRKTDHLIWFGHYPTSCILSPGADTDIRTVIGGEPESLVYLCGHLHNFGGIVPRMYSLQKSGFLELEVGDWKLKRFYRLAAVDHGLISFVDLTYNQFPIILITNPKDRLRHIPDKESLSVGLESSHIRILVYSLAAITQCLVRIDAEEDWRNCTESPTMKSLFVAPWNPYDYRHGSHSIEVMVKDEEGRSATVSQRFSLDSKSASGGNFTILARFALMTDFTVIFVALFAVAYSLCVVPLLVFRVWHKLTVRRGEKRPRIKGKCLRLLVRRFWLLSSVNRLFYPLILFYGYLLVGPWTVGEIIDGHWGWVFMWGIFVKGAFMPGTLSYLYGFFQLLFCQLPLIVIYANMVDFKFREEFSGVTRKRTRFQSFWPHLPFILIITVELALAVFYFIAYGSVSFVLGPIRTWSVILHMILFHQAYNLKPKSLRSGMAVWKEAETDTIGDHY